MVVKPQFYTSGKDCSFLVLHKISTSAEWKGKHGMTHSPSYIYTVLLLSNRKEKLNTKHVRTRQTRKSQTIEFIWTALIPAICSGKDQISQQKGIDFLHLTPWKLWLFGHKSLLMTHWAGGWWIRGTYHKYIPIRHGPFVYVLYHLSACRICS